jgi:hypothetical protein
MMETKVNIYNEQGVLVGFFVKPQIEQFDYDEYQIEGAFYAENGQLSHQLAFNPEAVPYVADLSTVEGLHHKRLTNVYVQRGRQPIKMRGVGQIKR